MKNIVTGFAGVAAALIFNTAGAATEPSCPEYLNHEFKRLHSSENVNLCSLYKEKPIVIVNTASHCGFTGQFKGLEALYQKYKSKDVEVIGFASDDFNQAAKNEEEAATICYKNYGVTFTMLAPTHVKGKKANPVFQHLNKATDDPGWNFNKYLISDNGKKIEHFGSRTKPVDSKLESALKNAL